jgi:GNAT superfamily N-acetyltransferase
VWKIDRLQSSYDRQPFSCGKPPLDTFLQTLASQYERRNLGRTYVAVRAPDPRVFGYYTLAAGSVAFQHVPPALARKLPQHPLPTVHLGRLAADSTVRGQGLGKALLIDALRRCLRVGEGVGIFGVDVFAIDEEAALFYEHFGFARLEDQRSHLLLPLKDVAAGLGISGGDAPE